jgi:hypothetical protein
MKRQLIVMGLTTIVMIVISVTIFSSCGKSGPLKYNGTIINPCENKVCYNGGTCLDGICNCPAGFEGADCNTTWNSRYVGNYNVTDECFNTSTYTLSIAPQINKANEMVIKGITQFCNDVDLNAVIGPDKTYFTIPSQRYCGEYYFKGHGTQTDDKQTVNIFLENRDSINHSSTYCSITLKLK